LGNAAAIDRAGDRQVIVPINDLFVASVVGAFPEQLDWVFAFGFWHDPLPDSAVLLGYFLVQPVAAASEKATSGAWPLHRARASYRRSADFWMVSAAVLALAHGKWNLTICDGFSG
jgi:hypothetical protein